VLGGPWGCEPAAVESVCSGVVAMGELILVVVVISVKRDYTLGVR